MSVVVEPVRNNDPTPGQVDGLNITLKKPDVSQQFANRIYDVREIEVTGCHFMKHRREKEKIFLTDQCDFEIGIAALFELERRVETAEAATKDEDASLFHGVARLLRSGVGLVAGSLN